MRHRPKRENYSRGIYGNIDYQERLERYCTYLENMNKALTEQCAIHDVSCCFFCGAKIKREGNSLHVWDIEYECGYKIWGAIDTETHGDSIEVNAKCPNSN